MRVSRGDKGGTRVVWGLGYTVSLGSTELHENRTLKSMLCSMVT